MPISLSSHLKERSEYFDQYLSTLYWTIAESLKVRKPCAKPSGTHNWLFAILSSSIPNQHEKVGEFFLKSTITSYIIPDMTLTSLLWPFGGIWILLCAFLLFFLSFLSDFVTLLLCFLRVLLVFGAVFIQTGIALILSYHIITIHKLIKNKISRCSIVSLIVLIIF